MINTNPETIKTNIKVAGWLLIANYAMMLIGGLIVFAIISVVRPVIGNDPVAQQVLQVVGSVIPVVLTIYAIPGIVAGIGLLTNQSWARILGIVMAALALTNVPFGTAIGAYVLWVLLSNPQQPLQTPPAG